MAFAEESTRCLLPIYDRESLANKQGQNPTSATGELYPSGDLIILLVVSTGRSSTERTLSRPRPSRFNDWRANVDGEIGRVT